MLKTLINRLPRRDAAPDSMASVRTPAEWAALAARLGNHAFARTETVKYVIDLHDDGRTYFLNSTRWLTHYAFVSRFVDPRADYNRFIVAEYRRDDRRFVLGSVLHYLDSGHWTVELDRTDTMSADMMVWMFERIASRAPVAVNLRFSPVSPDQIAKAESLLERVPVLTREVINATVAYQPVVLGVAYGYLRLQRGTVDVGKLRPYDLVVTDHVPIEIPPVAALVTGELQAPLAHVALLCRNRNTPDMALRGAVDLDEFRALEGQLVRITVGSQDYALARASPDEAETTWLAMRPKATYRPERDLSVEQLVNVDSLSTGAARFAGAKAAQIAELGRIEGITTPVGFVVPFAAYAAHLDAAGATSAIEAALGDQSFRTDAASRARRLENIRHLIVSHPVDAALLGEVQRRVRALSAPGPYILRSSTNAEDLPGFNGAGLYESLPVPNEPTDGEVADVLKRVWASVWLQRAFEEREWYRIDHEAVAMAALVQPMVGDAIATGVAITGNPFKEGVRGVLVNSQSMSATVTSATDNELPEQYLVANWSGEYVPEMLSRSSLTGGAPILLEEDLRVLTSQLLRIHDLLLPQYGNSANCIDVEFALTHERRFVILQARPHTIVYDPDRARQAQQPLTWLERAQWRLRRIADRIGVRPHRRVSIGTALSAGSQPQL